MKYKIYPPIGIARLGNSDEFFVGPEWPGGLGVELDASGNERDVTSFKDTRFQVKRQVARFRIFEFADAQAPGRLAQLPAGARIQWTAHLVNKKSAVKRLSRPPAEDRPTVPELSPPLAHRVLEGGVRQIAGANASPVAFRSTTPVGEPHPDYLGELRTDKDQQLLVFGGRGVSQSDNARLDDWYNNPGWFDDVSDGPVTATILLPDGTTIGEIEPAWVIVAPPDFVPTVHGVVTLYDLLFQVGFAEFGLSLPAQPSFTEHIYPLFKRASDLRWVNNKDHWRDIPTDFAALSQLSEAPSAAAQAARVRHAEMIRMIEEDGVLDEYVIPRFQRELLRRWENGSVQDDWVGAPSVNRTISAEGMKRAALEAGIGSGLHPGIEGGMILITRPDIYRTPFDFRFDHTVLKAGDVTALMALPWQADFLVCRSNWWPSQRPDIVRASAMPDDFSVWGDGIFDYPDMVEHVNKLGVLVPKLDAQGQIVGLVEKGRDEAHLPHLLQTSGLAAAGASARRVRRRKVPRHGRRS